MPDKVCKFGGTSLADAEQIRKVVAILNADSSRRFVVVSAPGNRPYVPHDRKVTDLLFLCHQLAEQELDIGPAFQPVRERYESIGRELGVTEVTAWLDEVHRQFGPKTSRDWMASRGEYLMGRLMARLLDARFVDADDLIYFRADGRVNDDRTFPALAEQLSEPVRYVIPGFYGIGPQRKIKLFPRGGSDITGAIIARAVRASVYENWTDVPGILMADPRIVPEAQSISEITYREIRELAYMGASALQHEAVFPLRDLGIPIHILNTNDPEAPGTRIVRDRDTNQTPNVVIGVAGLVGFSVIYIEKAMMNQERGFGRKVLAVLENHGVSYEHTPSSIDSMSIIISDEELGDNEEQIVEELRRVTAADTLEVYHDLAMIATVGLGMAQQHGIAGRMFHALGHAGINVRMINQGASQINIIIGVDKDDFERAVQVIYRAFVP